MDRLRRLFFFLVTLLVTAPALWGCGSAPTDDPGSTAQDLVEWVDHSPPRESVEYAMSRYQEDPAEARAHAPMSLNEFFGRDVSSMNQEKLRIELLKPNPRVSSQPIAFLHAEFYGSDGYWNNRYKDVQLFRLVGSTGGFNPYPEAAHVPREGAALVRIWNGYRPIGNGAPPELGGDALMGELARIGVWSYVSGNSDGPATNGGNGGFAPFKDASGRTTWRGVLVDSGAAWNAPEPGQQPWNTNLLGRGEVQGAHIPMDVVNGLTQIARAPLEDLAQRSRFEQVDDGAMSVVRDQQARARQVLDHYGFRWNQGL